MRGLRLRLVSDILPVYLSDTRKARLLGSDGTYSVPRAARNGHGFSVQEHLMRLANEGPRSLAMLAPFDTAMGEGRNGTASESEESNSQATSNATV